MIHVANRKCIRNIGLKSMRAAKTRNIVAILAIALTTVLFTSLFTIALSINDSFEQANFRLVGGYGHGTFKYITKEQVEELKDDPLIKEYGLRKVAGMPSGEPFQKSQVEISWCDANGAKWSFAEPEEGRLPKEGTKEAATDTKVLSLLGVEPEIGAEFTITFNVDGKETTQTFALCGWWEYDEAIVANHVLIPQSRVDAIFEELDTQGNDGMTGFWNMDVMFKNAAHIEQDMKEILERHGYQDEGRSKGDNYIATGVNWGYTGAQLSENMDPVTVIGIVFVLLLIIFTGYLIIYNVFQISVVGDIRFYGLLKTIGTTPRQIKSIIRQQALLLSLGGIPLGLVGGWFVGAKLTPVVVARLEGLQAGIVSLNPIIFIVAAVFSLFTVLLSCRRPGHMAGQVSPIEAIRYTEGGENLRLNARKNKKNTDKKRKSNNSDINSIKVKTVRRSGKFSLLTMACANLGRDKRKMVITILSLSLAVVLLNMTVTFTNGFDMEKYIANNVVSDFIVGSADHFQVGRGSFNADVALPQEIIDKVKEQGEVTEAAKVYGKTSWIEEEVTESYFRQTNEQWYSTEELDDLVNHTERTKDGLLADNAQLYGMEKFALDKLEVIEGDISTLYEPGAKNIASVYMKSDYGDPYLDSHWAKLGDKVKLRYIEEYEYYNWETGEVYDNINDIPDGDLWSLRAVKYHEEEYTVTACVTMPTPLSYRYYGDDEFVLNAQTFVEDTKTNAVMIYTFDTTDESNDSMEAFLADYTKNQNPQYDYESKSIYEAEFESFRSMFMLLGGALSGIVGLVGILNFFNAVLTGILTRKREFAMEQSIGMTGKQLKCMLVWEGLCYAMGAVVLSLAISIVFVPVMQAGFSSMFWFFTYRFTIMPILIVAPIFAVLGCVVPLVVYRSISKLTIVERLRDIE